MSAPVDVLAELDEQIARLDGEHLWIAERYALTVTVLRRTRAAVAELLEAVGSVYGEPCTDPNNAADDPCAPDCMSCRIRIAYARCKGEGA